VGRLVGKVAIITGKGVRVADLEKRWRAGLSRKGLEKRNAK
jgi:uncharacterized protein (DUF433 family)